jgi:hypothetical protein
LRALLYLLAGAVAWIGVSAAQAQTAPDVTAAIRASVKLTPDTLLYGAQMSPLRTTQGPQLGDAMTCLKLAGEPPAYIAVFFERAKVLSYRRAVAFDHCAQGPFTALVVAAKPNIAHKKTAHPQPHGEAAAK